MPVGEAAPESTGTVAVAFVSRHRRCDGLVVGFTVRGTHCCFTIDCDGGGAACTILCARVCVEDKASASAQRTDRSMSVGLFRSHCPPSVRGYSVVRTHCRRVVVVCVNVINVYYSKCIVKYRICKTRVVCVRGCVLQFYMARARSSYSVATYELGMFDRRAHCTVYNNLFLLNG